MRYGKGIGLTILSLLIGGSVAFAQKDDAPIVYAARYYTPPTSKGHSYFHIYRIGPDGSGKKQLTDGKANDSDPHWSSDGRQIFFIRQTDDSDLKTLYKMQADGTGEQKLYSGSISELDWQPGSEEVLFDEGEKHLSFTVRTGAVRVVPESDDTDSLPDVSANNDGIVLTISKTTKPLHLKYDKTLQKAIVSGDLEPDAIDPYGYMPHNGPFLLQCVTGNSTNGHWYLYYSVDEKAGTLAPFAEGNGLYWSPQGDQFATMTGRDLAKNGKKPDGSDRMVWVSPLLVGTVQRNKAKVRPIVQGTVYVIGCDWKPGTK